MGSKRYRIAYLREVLIRSFLLAEVVTVCVDYFDYATVNLLIDIAIVRVFTKHIIHDKTKMLTLIQKMSLTYQLTYGVGEGVGGLDRLGPV